MRFAADATRQHRLDSTQARPMMRCNPYPIAPGAILVVQGHAVDTQATQVRSQGWIGAAALQGPLDDGARSLGRSLRTRHCHPAPDLHRGVAELYRQLGRDADGEKSLRMAIAASPRDGGLHHALGLALTRLNGPTRRSRNFRQAAELDPERARYSYVYAVALHSAGRGNDAIGILKESLARHRNDRDTLLALVNYSRESGDIPGALDYAERLARIHPDDRDLARLIQALRLQTEKPGAQ
jgi:tetratricopeptide (TPR) repeat protein